MSESKRIKLNSIEDAIRLKSHEMFNYWYKRNTYNNYKLLRIACEYKNYHIANKLCDYIETEEEMEYIVDTEHLILEMGEFTTLMYFAKYDWFR